MKEKIKLPKNFGKLNEEIMIKEITTRARRCSMCERRITRNVLFYRNEERTVEVCSSCYGKYFINNVKKI